MVEVTGNHIETITLNDKGEDLFKVGGRSVSIWVDEAVKKQVVGL